VRPRCEAVPMPRHNMIIGSKRSPERLMGRSPGGSKASFAGVRSPPLHGVAVQGRWPSGENPGLTRRAVFSEGRTPCVRLVRPCPNRCIALFEEDAARPVA
jgi:hypothetical protein